MKNPEDLIRDEIRALAAYHVPSSAGMVKLDAMENPYTLPAEVRARIAAAVSNAEVNRYPDAAATRLKEVLKSTLAVPADVELVLGNGSDEIIQMLMLAAARPGATVLGLEPSFVMFRMIATFCGLKYVGVALGPDFSLDAARVIAAMKEHEPALTFIAYPNNPTGNLFEETAVDAVIGAASGLVVIDEAYHAFAGRTYMDRIAANRNLLVMRTLSKSGLAGLRLGLIAGRAEWLRHVDKVRLPYNVNVLTQLVAAEVLAHETLLEEQAAAIRAERARLVTELARIPDTTPYPSDANFILFRVAAAGRAFDALRQRGVLIKNMHGAHPSLENCLRVTVGTREENDRFLAALRQAAG
ncbi:MAG TPA: histidinol-phosphate transaminase [Burkholderiales bacterium]|nr:histidinol-phosphate transaminase [Burkholderiales bacterium]